MHQGGPRVPLGSPRHQFLRASLDPHGPKFQSIWRGSVGTRPISVTTICTSPFWPEWCPTYRSRATRCSQDSTTSPLGGNVPFFPLQTAGVLDLLPPAKQRRDRFQHDQGEVWSVAIQQKQGRSTRRSARYCATTSSRSAGRSTMGRTPRWTTCGWVLAKGNAPPPTKR